MAENQSDSSYLDPSWRGSFQKDTYIYPELNNLDLNKDQGDEIIESNNSPGMKHEQTPSSEQIPLPATPKVEEAHHPLFNSNPTQPEDNIVNKQSKDIITGDFSTIPKEEAPSSSLQSQDIEDSNEFEDEDSESDYYTELNEDHQFLQE